MGCPQSFIKCDKLWITAAGLLIFVLFSSVMNPIRTAPLPLAVSLDPLFHLVSTKLMFFLSVAVHWNDLVQCRVSNDWDNVHYW